MSTRSWQVGRFKITRVVEQAAVRSPEFGYRNLTPDQIKAQTWLQPHFATEEGDLKSAIQAFIIDTGEMTIVVDTCVGNDKERGNPAWHKMQTGFLDDLTAAGYAPETVDRVLCTHLHVDHVGWNTVLVDGRWTPTFPNAKYLFGRVEWDHWQQETVDATAGDIEPAVVEAVIDTPAVNQDSIRPVIEADLHELVEMDHQICPGIHLEPTPGHTPGHVSVVLESDGEKAVITGDLMHHPIQCALPDVSSKFDHNVEHAKETRRAFLERYGDQDVLVFGTHFADPTAGHLISQSEGWHLKC